MWGWRSSFWWCSPTPCWSEPSRLLVRRLSRFEPFQLGLQTFGHDSDVIFDELFVHERMGRSRFPEPQSDEFVELFVVLRMNGQIRVCSCFHCDVMEATNGSQPRFHTFLGTGKILNTVVIPFRAASTQDVAKVFVISILKGN